MYPTGNIERFSTTKTDTDICDSKRSKRSDGPYKYGQKEKTPYCTSCKSLKRKPVKPHSGNFQYPSTFFEKRYPKKSSEGKYKEQPRIAVVDTKHTIQFADNKVLNQKLI